MIIVVAWWKDVLAATRDSSPKWIEQPVAVTWLLQGAESDVERAKQYAKAEGLHRWEVFTFSPDEADPLGLAKRALASRY